MFFGSIIFEFIGVVFRYLYHMFYCAITGERLKSFKEIWNGPDSDDPINNVSYSQVSIIIGIMVLVIFILITKSW